MTSARTTLDAVRRRRPEWQAWLAVVDESLRETANGTWDAFVPDLDAARAPTAPLLAGATLSVPAKAVHRLLKTLIASASRDGLANMTTLPGLWRVEVDLLALFSASVSQDVEPVHAIAAAAGIDGDALHAVAALLPLPFLQACRQRWATSISPGWSHGYCPVCGAWPAFAEVRGIERTRFCRCGRCGGEWHSHALQCPFCSTNDHDDLVALVPEHDVTHGTIEACRRCQGYMKVFTKLQGCPPDAIAIEDLASVHLDVAALERGYARPAGAGYALGLTVTEPAPTRRFSWWPA